MTAFAGTLTLLTVALALVAPGAAQAQGPGVTFERILNAESEPETDRGFDTTGPGRVVGRGDQRSIRRFGT